MNTNESRTDFNLKELMQYAAYERVRSGGKYNMYNPLARQAAGLTSEQYSFVMANYEALRKQHEEENA